MVDCIVELTEGRGDAETPNKIQNFLVNNMGKWERFTEFLRGIGFPAPQTTNYGDNYNISVRFDTNANAYRVTVSLKVRSCFPSSSDEFSQQPKSEGKASD
jgi:hypothetical protein